MEEKNVSIVFKNLHCAIVWKIKRVYVTLSDYLDQRSYGR